MKIFSISDLHLEFYKSHTELLDKIERFLPSTDTTDVLVLAGDIGNPISNRSEYQLLLQEFKKRYKHVLLVLGNHEFYGLLQRSIDMNSVKDIVNEICNETGVVFLDMNSVVIDGVRFVGTTLWSKADKRIEESIADFVKVYKDIDEYNREFDRCFSWLKTHLEQCHINNSEREKIVVITHHLPTEKLCHSRFERYRINSAFATDILDDLVLDDVCLWFCGHTHERMVHVHEKVNGDKLTVSVNPVGYPYEMRVTRVMTDIYEI